MQKQDPYIYAVYLRPTSDLETYTDWKWRDGQRYSIEMKNKRKQYFSQKKIDFKIKTIKWDKEGCHVMIKGSVLGEDIMIANTYAPAWENLKT